MKTFRAVFWMLVGLALGGGALYFGLQGLRGVVADRELWEKGTPAPHVRVGGRVKTNRMILKDYHLEVDFQDTSGGVHHGQEEFTTLFTSVDQERPPELRYDPADPSRFVVSWARDVTGGRMTAAVFFVVMGPLFLVGAVLYFRGERRRGPAPSSPPVPTEWR
jgi:hypothetical protein